jgi:large subunit ribosomal protein L29
MAKMEELKGKSAAELKSLIAESKKELMGLRFKKVNGQVSDTSQFKKIRKTIAQVQTIMYQSLKA